MGTRCNIHFCRASKDKVEANIYRHWDGDTRSVQADLQGFFDDVEAQCGKSSDSGTRFNDPSYLAAKYLVWQAGRYSRDQSRPLNFLSVAPVVKDSGDGEYIHHVLCKETGRPEVVSDDLLADETAEY